MNPIDLLFILALSASIPSLIFSSQDYINRFSIFGLALFEGIIPIMVIGFYILKISDKKTIIKFYLENKLFLIFCAYVIISSLFNTNPRTLITLAYLIILNMFIIIGYSYVYKQKGSPDYYDLSRSLSIFSFSILILESFHFFISGWGDIAYYSVILQDKTSGGYFWSFLFVLNLWSISFRYTKSKLLILLGSLFYSIICGSRTAMITVIFLSSLIIFYKMNNKKKIILLFLIGIAVLISLLLISKLFYIPTISNKLFHSDIGILNTDLSGRELLIPIIFDNAIKYQPWGAGLGSGDLYINYITNWVGNTHNEYLAIFHDLGIIGVLLYLMAIFSFIFKTIKLKSILLPENSKYFYLLGVSFLIISLIISFFDSLWPYYLFLTNFIFLFAGFTLGMKRFNNAKVLTS